MLARKHSSLLFLYSLATSPRPSRLAPTSLPSLAPPPPSHPSSASPSPISPSQRQPKGKSRADLLREYRRREGERRSGALRLLLTLVLLGRPHLPENLILRDTLYLLQGISGRYVSFAPGDETNLVDRIIFREDPVRAPSILTKYYLCLPSDT